jgi:hypothetical protein
MDREPCLLGGVKGHNIKRNLLSGKPRAGELHLKFLIPDSKFPMTAYYHFAGHQPFLPQTGIPSGF